MHGVGCVGLVLMLALLGGLAGAAPLPNAVTGAGKLLIDANSSGREVLRNIPVEAAMERFVLKDASGRQVAYVGLTEGEVGGVVFIDGHMAGTLTRKQAEAFYSCRGFATSNRNYWGKDAVQWADSLVQQMNPGSTVELVFSGKSTMQSIKSIVDNPVLGQIKSLLDIGTNPLNVVKTLNRTREDFKDRQREDALIAALGAVEPGDDESKLAGILQPQDINFIGDDLVMAYPKYSVDFLVQQGRVSLLQQPSFLQLARGQAALFYRPRVQWTRCTPEAWFSSMR